MKKLFRWTLDICTTILLLAILTRWLDALDAAPPIPSKQNRLHLSCGVVKLDHTTHNRTMTCMETPDDRN